MSMKKILEDLHRLQGLDTEIKNLRGSREAIPSEMAGVDHWLGSREQAWRSLIEKRQEWEKRRRTLEQQVEDVNLAIKKHQRQLFEVKTNKEYSAMLHEIASEKAKVSEYEEQILTIMEEIEAAAQAEALAKSELEKAQQEAARKKQELQQQAIIIESQLRETEAERQRLAALLPQELMAKYQRIAGGRNGLAVVPVKDGTCGGCFANLPTKVTVEVHAMEEIITCEACGRILVWPNED